MNSRVHPKYKTKHRVANWPEYERSLVRRGDVTVWMFQDAIAGWKPKPSGQSGGRLDYLDVVIETALTLRLVFHLPLRLAKGFLASVFRMMGVTLEVPGHTTLSQRGKRLNVALRLIAIAEPVHLFVDSTGLSMVDEGEWAVARHGGKGERS